VEKVKKKKKKNTETGAEAVEGGRREVGFRVAKSGDREAAGKGVLRSTEKKGRGKRGKGGVGVGGRFV